jgi:hypothetical protein
MHEPRMQDLVTALSLSDLAARITAAGKAASGNTGEYTDEGRALSDALCTAAGGAAGGDAQKALQELAQRDPARLRELTHQHLGSKGPLAQQLLASGLQELGVRVEALERKVDKLAVRLEEVFNIKLAELLQLRKELAHQPPAELAKTLKEWWKKNEWRLCPRVPLGEFVAKLAASLVEEGWVHEPLWRAASALYLGMHVLAAPVHACSQQARHSPHGPAVLAFLSSDQPALT